MSQELGRNIFAATKKASKEISRFRPKPEQGLEHLEPYFNIDSIDGLKKPGSDIILCLYSATVADCYREKGDIVSAAQWYKRASTFRICGGFPNLYAQMVIKHRLSDYYKNALMCIEQGRKEWKSMPLYKRIYYWLVSLKLNLNHPWEIPKIVSLELRAKGFEQELKLLTFRN